MNPSIFRPSGAVQVTRSRAAIADHMRSFPAWAIVANGWSAPASTLVRVVGRVAPPTTAANASPVPIGEANGEKSPQPSAHTQVSRTSPDAVSTSNATVSSPRSPIANNRPGPRHSLQLTSTPAVSIGRRAPEAGSTRRSWPATTYRSLQTASITATSRPSGEPWAHPSCTSLDVRTRSAPVVGSILTRGASYQAPSSVPVPATATIRSVPHQEASQMLRSCLPIDRASPVPASTSHSARRSSTSSEDSTSGSQGGAGAAPGS